MGIGDSKGAFHADEFAHEASPWYLDPSLDNNVIDPEIDPGSTAPVKNAIIPVSNHTGFRQSDNIEDERDSVYTLSQQWNDGVTGHAISSALFGSPVARELAKQPVTSTPLGEDAGLSNVGSQPFTPQNSMLDYIMQRIGTETHAVTGIAKAIRNVSRGYDDNFDTILKSSDEEEKFQDWKKKNAPNDSGEDYDLRGAFKEGLSRSTEDQHLPDTYKKPNHPTFSDQSKYAKDAPDLAGSWNGDTFIPPALK